MTPKLYPCPIDIICPSSTVVKTFWGTQLLYLTTVCWCHKRSELDQIWQLWWTVERYHPCQIWNQTIHNVNFGKGLKLTILALNGPSPSTRLSPAGQRWRYQAIPLCTSGRNWKLSIPLCINKQLVVEIRSLRWRLRNRYGLHACYLYLYEWHFAVADPRSGSRRRAPAVQRGGGTHVKSQKRHVCMQASEKISASTKTQTGATTNLACRPCN